VVARTCTGKCRRYAIDPCCPVHGIGSSRYVLNLVGMVAVFAVAAFGIFSAPASSSSNHIAAMQARAKPIICKVFGPYCQEALEVSWCESRHYKWARNGQYRGLCQMGSWERRTFGHAPGAWAQARAALRYFRASGRDWSPWECQP
jgi:hypothetical protein